MNAVPGGIVLFGPGSDECLRLVARALDADGQDYLRIDQEDFDDQPDGDLAATLRVGAHAVGVDLTHHGVTYDLGTARAVYSRPLCVGESPAARSVTQVLAEWLDLTDALCVNRPEAMASNASKPYQAQLVARAGFDVPVTLVTNHPERVAAFARSQRAVVYKSTSGIRSIVRDLDAVALTRLGRVRALPTQFQAKVPGVDVRVHVVGDELFATRISSDAVDYRYAHRDGRAAALTSVDLEPEVAQRCRRLARGLGLPLCGIDLRRRPDGAYVCFEVNPMPAFSYYEGHTGAPIGAAVAGLLARAAA